MTSIDLVWPSSTVTAHKYQSERHNFFYHMMKISWPMRWRHLRIGRFLDQSDFCPWGNWSVGDDVWASQSCLTVLFCRSDALLQVCGLFMSMNWAGGYANIELCVFPVWCNSLFFHFLRQHNKCILFCCIFSCCVLRCVVLLFLRVCACTLLVLGAFGAGIMYITSVLNVVLIVLFLFFLHVFFYQCNCWHFFLLCFALCCSAVFARSRVYFVCVGGIWSW